MDPEPVQTQTGQELMKKIIDMINEEGLFAHEEKPDINQVFGLDKIEAAGKKINVTDFKTVDETSVLWQPDDTKIKDQFEKKRTALPLCFFDVDTSFELSYKKSDTEIVIFDKRDNFLKILNTTIQEVDQILRKRFARTVILKKSLKQILDQRKPENRDQNNFFDIIETVTRLGPSKDLRDVIIGTNTGKLFILDQKNFKMKFELINPVKSPVTDFIQKQNFVVVAYKNGQINVFQRLLAFQYYTRSELKQPDHSFIRALKMSPYTKHFIAIQELNNSENDYSIIKDPSKVEKVSNALLLYDSKTLKLIGKTELISTKCRNYELKRIFDFCEKCIFIRSDCLRSFDVFSLDNCELVCSAPENIDGRQISLIQCIPDKQQVLLVGYYGDCYYYDSTGKKVDDDKHNNKYDYMITPTGFFDSKLVSLQDRLILCKLGKQIYNQTILFDKNQQVIYFSDEEESFVILLARIKPDFDNVIVARLTLNNSIFAHTYSAQNTKFMDFTHIESSKVIKTYKNFEPITCSQDNQYFFCKDVFNDLMFRINLENLESDLLEDIKTQMLCASRWDNFIFFRDHDEETNKYKLTIYDVRKKQKISQLKDEFDEEFFFQISNLQMVIIISTKDSKFIKVDCKRASDLQILETISTEIGQSSHINFDSTDMYFLTGSSKTGDIYIYDLATMKLIQTIDIHKGLNTIGYFVEKDRLVTKNLDKLVYWKFDGKLELLFTVKEPLIIVMGYNRALSGIIRNQEISLWTEKLTHELTDNCLIIKPHSLKQEWVKGPLIQVYPQILNHFLNANQQEKIQLMPHILKYVILPYGFTILSKFVFTNQKILVKEACKILDQQYIRDIYGNTPLLYALKRQDYESINTILMFISQKKELMNQISFSAILLLIKVAPQQLCPFFESSITEISQGMVELGCKLDDYNQNYYEYDLAQLLRADVIHQKLLNLKAPETEMLPIIFYQSQLNLNCELGSIESILFAQALAKCPNEAIFRTKFVHNLLQHKWSKMKNFANLLLFLTIAFTATISVHSFTPGQKIYIHLLKLQNYFWALIEIIIFWQSGYSLKYNGEINILLFIILNIYCWFTVENASPEIDSLLPLINWLAWFQMILQLQCYELIRTFVSIFLECIKSLAAFNYFLVLMIFTFATTQDIIQKNMVRHKLIGKDRGPYSVEFYDQHHAIQNQTQNLVELWNSVYDTWIAIIKGDFVDNEGNLWRGFVYVSTFISTVVLLNLIIAFMSDSYANAIAKIEEKKNKTLNQMTLRLEKVMFWRKNYGKKTLLVWADYENNSVIQEEESEDVTAIIQSVTKSELLSFMKKLDNFLYDISLLVIQSKQKLNIQIDNIENDLSEQLKKKLNAIKLQISEVNLMDGLKKKMKMKFLPVLKRECIEKEEQAQKELNKNQKEKINQNYLEKQNEANYEQLSNLQKLVSDKIGDYQKQLKGMNKNFDKTIHSLVDEINQLMVNIYKDDEDVVSQTSSQREMLVQQKQEQIVTEQQQQLNVGLNKIQGYLNTQLQSQQKQIFVQIEKKFRLLQKQIQEDLLKQIKQSQQSVFREMVKSLEKSLDGKLKFMKTQEISADQQQEQQYMSLSVKQLQIQQQLSQLILLVQKHQN